MNSIHLTQIIPDDLAGYRLDAALAKLLPQFSRSQIQTWIENGQVNVNQKKVLKNKERVIPGQTVAISAELEDRDEWQAEQIPLDIVHEDESVLIINKPAGLVVHPAAGNYHSTLVNALLYYDPNLKKLPRAGLIHRLDKDTSGLLIVARTLIAQHFLAKQMHDREIHRIYAAIICGQPLKTGTVDAAIGRHPTQRTKMAVLNHGGRPARTHYRVLEQFTHHALLEIELETGRTHQIRVHMTYINHPIVGDPLYNRPRNYTTLPEALREHILHFPRQALHAKKIIFQHPDSLEDIEFESPLPDDFQYLLTNLRRHKGAEDI